jgi:CBS domain-containing protein
MASTKVIGELEIRSRHTLAGDGESTTVRSVFCPRRARSMTVEECFACPQYAGVATGAAPALLCQHPSALSRRMPTTWFTPSRSDRTPVREVMTPRVVCVRPEVGVEELEGLLRACRLRALPVVDEAGVPLGVAGVGDLVNRRADASAGGAEAGTGPGARHDLVTAGDVMGGVALALSETSSVAQAAAFMAFEGVHRVPVVDDEGKVVGILTALDLLRWLAQQDGYVLEEP